MSNPAAEIFAAVQVLRKRRLADQPELPEVIDWLLSCHDDLSRIDRAADMWDVERLSLVDEPASVRCALAVARAINGSAS